MDSTPYEERIRELEKANRILQKKLERSEVNRVHLEENYEVRERLLQQVIQDLEQSQTVLEVRNQDLEEALVQLQTMQAKLVESEKMSALGVLVAGIAHEINNPINFVHGNIVYAGEYIRSLIQALQVYQEAYPCPDPSIDAKLQDFDLEFLIQDLFKLLESMKLGSERIRKIVLGLRSFARMDESDFKEADIHEGLDSTLMILQHQLKETKSHPTIQVTKHYSKLPKVLCYAGQLNQVFMNILSNAIDALRDPASHSDRIPHQAPQIWIHTELIEKRLIIRIGNNGADIPEVIRSRLFEPFFTTKSIGKGTGLGLSISYQIIVEKHQGCLSCVSTPDGTEFVIEIPVRSLGNKADSIAPLNRSDA